MDDSSKVSYLTNNNSKKYYMVWAWDLGQGWGMVDLRFILNFFFKIFYPFGALCIFSVHMGGTPFC